MAERVHGQVQLGAARALVPVPPRASATLGRAAQGAAVEPGRGRLLLAPGRQAEHRAQVVGEHLEAAGPPPAPGLVADGVPRRQVVWHSAPGDAVANDVARAVEHLAQPMLPLLGGLGQQGRAGHHQRPFFVGHVGPVRFAGNHHAPEPGTQSSSVHNTL